MSYYWAIVYHETHEKVTHTKSVSAILFLSNPLSGTQRLLYVNFSKIQKQF